MDSGTRTNGTNDCTFERKLCVKCTAGSPVMMHVQGNGLPLNCFDGTREVKEQNIDFELVWNPDPGYDSKGNA